MLQLGVYWEVVQPQRRPSACSSHPSSSLTRMFQMTWLPNGASEAAVCLCALRYDSSPRQPSNCNTPDGSVC